MSQSAEKYYTVEDYFALEEKSTRKSEFYNGTIYLMSGGSMNHNLICGNAYYGLRQALQGSDCRVLTSDMRILVKDEGMYTYPDVTVVCGEVEFVSGRDDTLSNPTLLVEVLSPSTRNYDRGEKFLFYRSIQSLQYYLVIDQLRFLVECHQRLPDETWGLKTYTNLEQEIALSNLGISLKMTDLYERVKLPASRPKRPRERIVPHPVIEE